MAKVVFMGTPEYAVPSLEALVAHHQVVLVVTQPDRRRGRGRKVSYSPVKTFAIEHDLPIWQPKTLRSGEAAARLRAVQADVYVTAAIGLILTADVLALAPHGCINVHASLLPRWRGAAPVSAAILHGDDETGVTLMRTDEGLDTGPILAQTRCPIRADDTTATLTPRLARLGADLLRETLPRWLSGQVVPQPQPDRGVTYARRLTKEDGRINWQQPAAYVERMVRAYTPWPGAHTTYGDKMLKILRAHAYREWQGTEPPGRVIALPDKRVAVTTGKGALVLDEIQLAGKRAMSPDAFCRGYGDFVGSVLGEPAQPLPRAMP
jgi:methionyl-tRNA formyltransferase